MYARIWNELVHLSSRNSIKRTSTCCQFKWSFITVDRSNQSMKENVIDLQPGLLPRSRSIVWSHCSRLHAANRSTHNQFFASMIRSDSTDIKKPTIDILKRLINNISLQTAIDWAFVLDHSTTTVIYDPTWRLCWDSFRAQFRSSSPSEKLTA